MPNLMFNDTRESYKTRRDSIPAVLKSILGISFGRSWQGTGSGHPFECLLVSACKLKGCDAESRTESASNSTDNLKWSNESVGMGERMRTLDGN